MSDRYEPPHLKEVVEAINYKPGWQFYVDWYPGEDREPTLKLRIVSWTTDSFDFVSQRQINHFFLVPPASYNRTNWVAWVFDRIRDVENHEAGEFFRVNGVREFAPHHANGEDPYRVWHVSDWQTANKSSGDS